MIKRAAKRLGGFDPVIAIDTLYFADLDQTIACLKAMLRPGGQLLACYSQGADPPRPLAVFRRDTLLPDQSDLAVALTRYGLAFAHGISPRPITARPAQEENPASTAKRICRRGQHFLYDNRYGEACGVAVA